MLKHQDLTERIIAAFYEVYNTLGWGFLEKVYQNAMQHELQKRGLRVYPQAKIDVFYDGVHVGEYFADLLVEDRVILELKSGGATGPGARGPVAELPEGVEYRRGFIVQLRTEAPIPSQGF